MQTFDGMLLVDKPAGWSSFKVVAVVRRILSEQAGHKIKVGHAGTLDPFATGLLIILVGKACKEADRFLKLDKTYEATAILGQQSTTGDPEGEISEVSSWEPSDAEIQTALQQFRGEVTQTPPIYSAIKVGGVRAYQLARKGKEVKIQPRQVTVYQLTKVSYAYPELTLRCAVSSGTYIRSLVEDIGNALGVGAYTTALRRTHIAAWKVTDALQMAAENPSAEEIVARLQPT
ncbi:MAG TPA: tRNA pseudouridine(55) synthase TruB [Candidatus Saccharimonadales bacterium]|nr:tRNA pseudouridine(55) synthase TruB [Candidatus Saccharimonadales bacterium]